MIAGNTSTGQSYGVHLARLWNESTNKMDAITLSGNTLAPNSLGDVGKDSTVVVSGYTGPAITDNIEVVTTSEGAHGAGDLAGYAPLRLAGKHVRNLPISGCK